jgi:FdhD protein
MTRGSFAVDVSKIVGGRQRDLADCVAVEEPLEIRLGFATPDGPATRSLSITMRTPGHDAELAAGFLYTESIVNDAADISAVGHCGPPATDSGHHNVIRVDLATHVDVDLTRLTRHFYTTSSCGVCGKTSLDALRVIGLEPFARGGFAIQADALTRVPESLRRAQDTFEETGGLHAAAVFDAAGELAFTREDVGRHNAVDKVVGALLLAGRLPAGDLGLMVSGRASFELMQKALVAGMPLLAAVGATNSI